MSRMWLPVNEPVRPDDKMIPNSMSARAKLLRLGKHDNCASETVLDKSSPDQELLVGFISKFYCTSDKNI